MIWSCGRLGLGHLDMLLVLSALWSHCLIIMDFVNQTLLIFMFFYNESGEIEMGHVCFLQIQEPTATGPGEGQGRGLSS